jgi:hypothetical protein
MLITEHLVAIKDLDEISVFQDGLAAIYSARD